MSEFEPLTGAIGLHVPRQAARRLARARAPRRAMGRRRRRRPARPRCAPRRRADDQLRAHRRPAGPRGGPRELAAGGFDWLTVTSATTVDVLSSYDAVIPETTKVAAVGETTAAALAAAGYHVDFVPVGGQLGARPARGVGRRPPTGSRPARARPALGDRQAGALDRPRRGGPRRRGRRRLPHGRRAGRRQGRRRTCAPGASTRVLVTSGSVAEQVQQQLGPIPEEHPRRRDRPADRRRTPRRSACRVDVDRPRAQRRVAHRRARGRRDAARLTQDRCARPPSRRDVGWSGEFHAPSPRPPRRLRETPAMRRLVSETRLRPGRARAADLRARGRRPTRCRSRRCRASCSTRSTACRRRCRMPRPPASAA